MKNFPVAKRTIQTELGVSTAGLAAIDTGYLATYAIGQFAGGWLGDRIGSRRLIGYGMVASAFLIAAFGASSSASLFALFFGLNGFVQATGWPGNVKAMAAWYGPTERGGDGPLVHLLPGGAACRHRGRGLEEQRERAAAERHQGAADDEGHGSKNTHDHADVQVARQFQKKMQTLSFQ